MVCRRRPSASRSVASPQIARNAENPLRTPRSRKLRSNRPLRSTAAATGTRATSSKAAAPQAPPRMLPGCLRKSASTFGRTTSSSATLPIDMAQRLAICANVSIPEIVLTYTIGSVAIMANRTHGYGVGVTWPGSTGSGTSGYRDYARDHDVTGVETPGKPVILGSADPAFRGDPQRWNPEELLVVSLS